MKKLYILWVIIGLITSATWAQVVQAATIDLTTVSPAVDANITPPDDGRGDAENFHTFWFKGQIDQTYTATFSVSEEPAFTFVSGGAMTLEDNIAYDETTGEFSVTYTAKPLEQIDSQSGLELEDNQTLTIVAISFPVGEGEDGPSENTIGSWVASSFQEWSLVTPSQEQNAMGATLRGDVGDTGHFTMFMPTSALHTMAVTEAGSDANVAVRNFSLFEGETKSDASIQAVDGGAFVNFSTTIPETVAEEHNESILQSVQSEQSGTPSLDVLVSPKPIASLNRVTKGAVNAGEFIRLKGKLRTGAEGKRVILLRTLDGSTYSKIATTVSKANGVYAFRVKVNARGGYRVKVGKSLSEVVRVMLQ